MNMIKSFVCIGVCIAAAAVFPNKALPAGKTDKDLPKVRQVDIQDPVTRLVVDILPGRGVLCIFPWVLDQNSYETPYKSTITNGAVFEQERGEHQNSLIFKLNGKVKTPQLEGEVSDAFISVAGYHFNLTLRVNLKKSAHYSTVIFNLSDAKKIELVDDAIRQRRRALEKEFADKEKTLDERARKLALKEIARTVMDRPRKRSVYEKERLKLPNGDRLMFMADEILTYGDMHIIKVAAENDSGIQTVYINGIQIEKKDVDNRPILLEYELAPKLEAGQRTKGFVVTRDPRVVDGHDTTMTLLTDQGEVELKW